MKVMTLRNVGSIGCITSNTKHKKKTRQVQEPLKSEFDGEHPESIIEIAQISRVGVQNKQQQSPFGLQQSPAACSQ